MAQKSLAGAEILATARAGSGHGKPWMLLYEFPNNYDLLGLTKIVIFAMHVVFGYFPRLC